MFLLALLTEYRTYRRTSVIYNHTNLWQLIPTHSSSSQLKYLISHDNEAQQIAESGRELALIIGQLGHLLNGTLRSIPYSIFCPPTHDVKSITGSPRCVTYVWKEALIALAEGQHSSVLQDELNQLHTYEVTRTPTASTSD